MHNNEHLGCEKAIKMGVLDGFHMAPSCSICGLEPIMPRQQQAAGSMRLYKSTRCRDPRLPAQMVPALLHLLTTPQW